MFRSWRNTIESDEGFTLKVLGGRGGLRYTEGDRSVEIDSEFAGGRRGVIVYSDSIKWWEGSSGQEAVDVADRARIVENIRRAFKADGYETEVV